MTKQHLAAKRKEFVFQLTVVARKILVSNKIYFPALSSRYCHMKIFDVLLVLIKSIQQGLKIRMLKSKRHSKSEHFKGLISNGSNFECSVPAIANGVTFHFTPQQIQCIASIPKNKIVQFLPQGSLTTLKWLLNSLSKMKHK